MLRLTHEPATQILYKQIDRRLASFKSRLGPSSDSDSSIASKGCTAARMSERSGVTDQPGWCGGRELLSGLTRHCRVQPKRVDTSWYDGTGHGNRRSLKSL